MFVGLLGRVVTIQAQFKQPQVLNLIMIMVLTACDNMNFLKNFLSVCVCACVNLVVIAKHL